MEYLHCAARKKAFQSGAHVSYNIIQCSRSAILKYEMFVHLVELFYLCFYSCYECREDSWKLLENARNGKGIFQLQNICALLYFHAAGTKNFRWKTSTAFQFWDEVTLERYASTLTFSPLHYTCKNVSSSNKAPEYSVSEKLSLQDVLVTWRFRPWNHNFPSPCPARDLRFMSSPISLFPHFMVAPNCTLE